MSSPSPASTSTPKHFYHSRQYLSSSSTGTDLSRYVQHRPAGANFYSHVTSKGASLLRKMLDSNHEAGQMLEPPRTSVESLLVDPSNIDKWGYVRSDYENEFQMEGFYHGAARLAVGSTWSEPVVSYCEHNEERTIDGTTYLPTEAAFENWCSPSDGVIIAHSNYGPAYQCSERLCRPTPLPHLKHWSDIVFLQYVETATLSNTTIRNLSHVFRRLIRNPETRSVIDRILRDESKEPEMWPGFTLNIDTQPGKAILGTPNGSGVAFLLFEHKRQLGHKYVDRVTIYHEIDPGDYSVWPSVLFYIKDVVPGITAQE
ncbi:hypothetical protein K505DRAFT_357393 [Melanomma pulvis-pyrius CBS 109.77]|uniref:Uncharacterized protein n=1 Tax=Melanomma pulvis-pyrius CBS 109.77 TaxID=1314802 RepID=A0A6A6XSI9_9PLEO|nr:hypothetical protein K505DRAFT_357393 [Melanomma pulvis-pyrius CBS 109.77]